MGYLALWAIVVGICFGINAILKRPAINPGRIALILFFIVMAIDIAVAAYVLADTSASSAPFDEGQLFGRAVGRSLIPLILSVVVDNSFRKKHPPKTATVPR